MARVSKKREERKERVRAGSGRRDKAMRSKGRTTIKIPEGVSFFVPEDKKYRLDIVPYEVGKGNPYADKGEWYYERTFFTHRIGADNRNVVCPAKTWGKPCPVCEELGRVMRDPDSTQEEEKSLKPSQRQMWLVRDRDDTDKGVQLYEVSWYIFGQIIDELRNDADDDEEHITDFDDPKAGAILQAKFVKNPPYGLKCLSIDFRPRPNGLPEDVLDHGICLDDLLVETSYEEMKKILFQVTETDEDAEEKPKKKVSKKKEPEPEDEPDLLTASDKGLKKGMEVEYEGEEMEIVKISKDGTSLTLKDSDGEIYGAVAVDEVTVMEKDEDEDVEEEEVEEPPKKKRGRPPGKANAAKSKPTKKVVEEEPEEDDDDIDDDEEIDEEEDDDDDDWDLEDLDDDD